MKDCVGKCGEKPTDGNGRERPATEKTHIGAYRRTLFPFSTPPASTKHNYLVRNALVWILGKKTVGTLWGLLKKRGEK